MGVRRAWAATFVSRNCTRQLPGPQATFCSHFVTPCFILLFIECAYIAIFPSHFLSSALAKIRKALDGKGGPIATVIRSACVLPCGNDNQEC
jgi:hypothetical protein